ncbi:MAG: DUF86 domain-containing protein [Nitrospirae bacterium]|nr:DUF86 domain-containing protein [Nitrospirota bacterium]
MTREWKFFIRDIYDAMQYIKEFVGTMKRKDFLADEKTRSAVAFKIENIGEASKNIPKEVRAKYKDLPWTDMARMRDKITHFYFGINYKVVWSVVKKELPAIEPAITKVLSDLKASKSTKKK